MTNPSDPIDESDSRAGEYVLGTLDAGERAAFEAELQRDPALQAEVYAWQDRLLSLSSHAAAVRPSRQLWPRIQGALDSRFGAATATATVPRAAASVTPWWQRLVAWQGISAIALAASVAMAVLLAQHTLAPPAPSARFVAVLQSPGAQTAGWVVEVEDHQLLRLRPLPNGGNAAVPSGHAMQFWTKAQNASAPTSLGLVRAGQAVDLPAASLPAVGEQQLFELTLEPEAGSPTGRPTGPILYVGRTVRL